MRTTTLASTNATNVGLSPISRPSTDEQGAICEFIDEILAWLARLAIDITVTR